MKKIDILWTGGWDSTYRIVELSMKEVIICPIYVLDEGRKSSDIEISTMNKIIELLKNEEKTKAKFEEIKIIIKSDIPENKEITEAYQKICETVKLGTQYEWLARYALNNPGIELGIEKPFGEYSGCITAIEKFGKFTKDKDDILIVDKKNSSKELNTLFGNFKFPIASITEKEMVNNIKELNYEHIMKHIWFCHTPNQDKPCGYCRPCQQKMECGMEFLLPRESQKNYCSFKKVKNLFGTKIANFYIKRIKNRKGNK